MKKTLIISALTLLAATLFVSCGGSVPAETEDDTPPVTLAPETGSEVGIGLVGLANPVVLYASAKDVKKATGIMIDAPEGATDISYSVIAEVLANVDFTFDGVEYTFRAEKTGDDISGLYGEKRNEHPLDKNKNAVYCEVVSGAETFRKITEKVGDTTYVLLNVSGSDEKTISDIFVQLSK